MVLVIWNELVKFLNKEKIIEVCCPCKTIASKDKQTKASMPKLKRLNSF